MGQNPAFGPGVRFRGGWEARGGACLGAKCFYMVTHCIYCLRSCMGLTPGIAPHQTRKRGAIHNLAMATIDVYRVESRHIPIFFIGLHLGIT